ncbi:hypothetical protein Fmac_020915 [Flemingia macrophylla]|uniref:23 kDa subunit of oxygen evolving system of photosystem II n=1 Tax=Flemingia macrophylla TaxID=520843 RepID=A0ABD1LVE8_9FABA
MWTTNLRTEHLAPTVGPDPTTLPLSLARKYMFWQNRDGPPSAKADNIPETVDYLLGTQTFFGQTDAEGDFDANVVATANILESSTSVIDGKQYYTLSVLTRTADGDESGKHKLITATVKDGKLYIFKAQAGTRYSLCI